MKQTCITCMCLLALFILASCSIDSPQGQDDIYYKFEDGDKNLMLNYDYKPDEIITYQNQYGETLHFKVLSNISKKKGKYKSGFLGSYLEYYYDSKIVRFEIIENNASFSDSQLIYIFSKSDGLFKNAINFPLWNKTYHTFIDNMDSPMNVNLRNYNNEYREILTINGHLFRNVVRVNSSSDEPLYIIYGSDLQRNVNKLFYDYDFGVIQFDDIEGNTWKVIYPG